MSTTTTTVAALVVLVAIALALALAGWARNRRSRDLRERFGAEYERAVEEAGSRQKAERLLSDRVQHRMALQLRELEPAARQRYVTEWRELQRRFVDDPSGAVGQADELVSRLMRDMGYPAGGFEQQVADVSVDHAAAVPSFRRAHELAAARASAATDDLRRAMLHYRELFEALLGQPAWRPGGAGGATPEMSETPGEVR